MRPKSVFLPYETKNGLMRRAFDLELFEDIDKVRKFLIGNRELARRQITYREHFDSQAIDEYMASRKPS